VQVEIDFETDSEKKESKNEKYSDKLSLKMLLAKAESHLDNNQLNIHYSNWWITPIIEINSPPPELA
jgi:hypothetical protein